MLRASGICVTGRLGGLQKTSARLPRYLGLPLQNRSLSVASLQRGRSILLRIDQHANPGRARNFWSSSKPIPPVSTPVPPPEITQQAFTAGNTSLVDEPPTIASASTSTPINSTLVSEPTAAVESLPSTESLTEALSSLSDPTLIASALQYGDFAALGISSWSPPGLCAWGMELLHVSTSLPWFWTIVGAGILSRVILFPISVQAMKSSVALVPHQHEVAAIREEMVQAQRNKDPLGVQRAALKQKALYEKLGVSIPMMMGAPFLQLPVTLGMFFGVKRICELPVEQLKWSGLSILPDLTIPDPTFILPILSTVLINLQLSVGLKDMSASPQLPHIINAFRLLSLFGIVFMSHLPSGVLVYLSTSVIAMIGQTLLLRIPAVRRSLGIPILPPSVGNKHASFQETFVFIKQWWKKKADQAREDAVKARRR